MSDSYLSTAWDMTGGAASRALSSMTATSPAVLQANAVDAVGRAMRQEKLAAGLEPTVALHLGGSPPATDAEAYVRAAALVATGARLIAGTAPGRALASASTGLLAQARSAYGVPEWEKRKGQRIAIYAYAAAVLRTQAQGQTAVLWTASKLAEASMRLQQVAPNVTTAPGSPPPVVPQMQYPPAVDPQVPTTLVADAASLPPLLPTKPKRAWLGPLILALAGVAGMFAFRKWWK